VDQPVQFARDIKQLFRDKDRDSMSFAFDLGAHADVSEHAEHILERLREGSMPCDGPWPEPQVDLFERWVKGGKQP